MCDPTLLALLTKYRLSDSPVKKNVSYANIYSVTDSPRQDRLEIADRLHSAAIHLLRSAAKPDALSGQGPARLSALSVLVFGGTKTLGELAAAERVKPPTMSRIVAGLKRSGLARIQKDGKDARRIQITVTAKGERLLQEARQRRIRTLAGTLAELGTDDLQLLDTAAKIIESALRRM
jgi:DNA-binding MarR family transcriptional regulator